MRLSSHFFKAVVAQHLGYVLQREKCLASTGTTRFCLLDPNPQTAWTSTPLKIIWQSQAATIHDIVKRTIYQSRQRSETNSASAAKGKLTKLILRMSPPDQKNIIKHHSNSSSKWSLKNGGIHTAAPWPEVSSRVLRPERWHERSLPPGQFLGPPAPITMWDLLGFKVQNYGIWIPWHPMNGSGKIIQQYRHPIQNVVGGLCAGQCGDAPIYHRNHHGFPVNTMTDSLDYNLGTILGSHHIFGMRVLFETTIQINRFIK